MSGGPVDRVLAALRDHGSEPVQHGDGWQACCPAHDDANPSLSVGVGDDGRALLHCHAGCDLEAITGALGIEVADLMSESSKAEIVATYDYTDEAGKLLFQVVRHVPKDFRQRRPDGHGGWSWSVKGVRRVPYRLPEVVAAIKAGRTVYVVEGEKDCDTLAGWGLAATCNSAGAGKWRREHSEALRGADVVVIPDADGPGREHAAQVVGALRGVAASVRLLELPGGKDVSEWASRHGGTREALEALVSAGPSSLVSVSAADLRTMEFKPARPVLPGLLVAGFCLLAGAPKLGKSWLALLVAVAKASGGRALGIDCEPSRVLFLGLEDSLRRLKGRMEMIPGGEDWPERLDVVDGSGFPFTSTAAVDELARYCDRHPDCDLIVCDTLHRLRGEDRRRGSQYELDLAFVAPFQRLAMERDLCLWGLAHTRKRDRRYSEKDGLESVSGTLGIPGAADAVMVLQRGRMAREAELLVTGRDFAERQLALDFDPTSGLWSLLGDAGELARSQAQRDILEALGEYERATIKQVAKLAGANYDNAKYHLHKLVSEGRVLRFGPGTYSLAPTEHTYFTPPTNGAASASRASRTSETSRASGEREVSTSESTSHGEANNYCADMGSGSAGSGGSNVAREPGSDDDLGDPMLGGAVLS